MDVYAPRIALDPGPPGTAGPPAARVTRPRRPNTSLGPSTLDAPRDAAPPPGRPARRSLSGVVGVLPDQQRCDRVDDEVARAEGAGPGLSRLDRGDRERVLDDVGHGGLPLPVARHGAGRFVLGKPINRRECTAQHASFPPWLAQEHPRSSNTSPVRRGHPGRRVLIGARTGTLRPAREAKDARGGRTSHGRSARRSGQDNPPPAPSWGEIVTVTGSAGRPHQCPTTASGTVSGRRPMIFDGRTVLVTGVLTEGLIAFHVARLAQEQGAAGCAPRPSPPAAPRRWPGGCPSRCVRSSSTSPRPRISPCSRRSPSTPEGGPLDRVRAAVRARRALPQRTVGRRGETAFVLAEGHWPSPRSR